MLDILQTLRRDHAPRVELAGYVAERHFRALGAGGHVLVGLRMSLTSALWMELVGRGDVLAAKLEGKVTPIWGFGGGAALGAAF